VWGGIIWLGYIDVLVVKETMGGKWFSPRTVDTCQAKNIVNCFTHLLGMCLIINAGMLLSPGPGQLLRSYIVNQVLVIHLVTIQRLKGILHHRKKERKKRPALETHFSEWNMFVLLTFRKDLVLGLCIFWILAKRKLLRNAKFRFFSAGETGFPFDSRHYASVSSCMYPKIAKA